ncbi:MAG TPA: VWA domain-containing protein [Candidatus Acidoferrales bacterium]|nr:VWA domain-containing protein [Candidatus Acidoferrales bacterium]
MNAAAGFSLPTVSLRVLLFCVLTPCAVLSAAQSPQTDSQQQTPAAAASSEVRTTQQSAPAPLAKTPTSDATSEVDAHPSVPFESHVNLVPVRVVVHDSSGKVVTNLTKEDFRLFQDRRAQTISVFTVETPASTAKQVVRGEATGEPVDTTKDLVPGTLVMPTRFVALLFDDVHLKMQDLLQARVAAMHYLDSSIDPSERVAIFTTSGQTQVDFTDDRAKIRAVVAQLMPHLIGAYDPTEDIDQCPQMGYYEADEILNKNDQNAIAAATADAAACLARTALSGIEDPSLAVQRSAQEMLLYGDTNAEYATRRLVEVVRRMSALPGQRSIVLISPGFLITTTHQYDISDVIDRATRANIFINSLDARGLYTVDANGDISRPLPIFSNPAAAGQGAIYRSQEQASQSDAMAELSDGTGGLFFRNNNNLDAGFRNAVSVPEVSYLLAFTPEALRFDGKFHQIKVTLATKSYTVQARRGFFAPKHGQTPEEAAKQDIEEAVFSQEERQGVPIELQLQYFKSNAVDAKLSVLTRVDVTRVRFEKTEGRNLGNLTVVAALFDRNGNFISGNQESVGLRLKDATLEKLSHSGMTVKMGFDVKPGGYIVRLVVRDSKASLLSARNGVIEIP